MTVTTGGIRAEGLAVELGGRSVLGNVDVDLQPGELTCLVGPNGAGKTTLLRTLLGDLVPSKGCIWVNGDELGHLGPNERALRVAFVPQSDPMVFPFTVLEVVLMGRAPHRPRFGLETTEDLEVARSVMEKLDIGHLEERTVTELSGGEQQRVLVARALAQDTPIVLLDEPAAHLDAGHRVLGYRVFREVAAKGRTVVCCAHDLNLAARFADRILVLVEGDLVAMGTPEDVLTEDVLNTAFGGALRVETSADDGRPFIVYQA